MVSRILHLAPVVALLLCSGCAVAPTTVVPIADRSRGVFAEMYYRTETRTRTESINVSGELDAVKYARIAVYPFDSDGYEPAKVRFCTDAVEGWFVRTGAFDVVRRQRLDTVIGEQDLPQSGRLDPSTVAELRRVLGVDAIVHGTLYRTSTDERWSIQILDAETAKVVWANNGFGSLDMEVAAALTHVAAYTQDREVDYEVRVADYRIIDKDKRVPPCQSPTVELSTHGIHLAEWEGATVATLDDARTGGATIPSQRGVCILTVVPGSPFDHAGLCSGDVIRRIGTICVTDFDSFLQAQGEVHSGAVVTIEIQRGMHVFFRTLKTWRAP